MSCRALGAPPPPAAQTLVSAEQYNALLERLDAEVRARAQLETELVAARDEVSFLHNRLSAVCPPHPSNPSVDTTPPSERYRPPPATVVHQRRPSPEEPAARFAPRPDKDEDMPDQARDANTAQDKEILSHCSDISGCKSGLRIPDTSLKKSSQRKSSTNLAAMAGAVTKKTSKSKKERAAKVKIPGQSRYWTPEEHKLFLEALNKYGHKDLRSISAYVGTRNMTQVRTHSQKYFMRLMREAKRQNPVGTKSNVSGDEGVPEKDMQPSPAVPTLISSTGAQAAKGDSGDNSAPVERDGAAEATMKEADNGDKYSVPNTCGMTLLCLVGQDTLPV